MAINFPDTPSVNDTYTVGNNRWIWTGSVWNLDTTDINDLGDVTITSAANGQTLIYDGTVWKNEALPSNEPMGFENAADSTISFNVGSRELSIAPVGASFTIWVAGKRFIKTTTQTVTIANTTGLHYIYFNTSGSLASKMTYFTWDQDAPAAYVYWNADTGAAIYVGDERHGVTLDWQTHEYLHRTRGAVIANGFGAYDYTTTGDGSLDTHAQISILDGTFFDEDYEIDIVDDSTPTANTFEQDLSVAKIPMFYHSGSTGAWVADAATLFPMKQGTLRARYNLNTAGTWSTADLTSGNFGITWVVATNNLGNPVIGILGQGDYNTLGDAEAVAFSDVDLTNFPSVEFRPLYKVVYQSNATYASTPKARIRGVYDLRQIGQIGTGFTANPVSDHGGLSGLADDDHTQYLTTGRHDAHDHSVALGTAALGDLGDVTVTGPTNGEILRYNGSQWINDTFTPVSNANLNDLADVSITGPASGDFLKWNGTAWVNDAIDLGTDTNGNYMVNVAAGTGISVSHTQGEGSTATVSIDATLDNLSDVSVAGVTNGKVLRYNGSAWVGATVAGGATISASAPASPEAGAIWFDSDDGKTYVYYSDGTSSQWVEIGGNPQAVTISDTAPASPITGQIWYRSDNGATYIYYDNYWVEVGGTSTNVVLNTFDAKGDLIVGTADNTISKLSVGTNGYVLSANSSTATGLEWKQIASDPLTSQAAAMFIMDIGA